MSANQSTPPTLPRYEGLRNITGFIQNPIPFLMGYKFDHGDTYIFFLGGLIKSVMTSDPEMALHVLQKNHRKYEKSYFQSVALAKFVGRGLLTATGDYWLKQRRLIQPGFHRARLQQVANLMHDEIRNYILRISQQSNVSLTKAMNELAFRVVGRTLFSTDTEAHGLYELSYIVTELQDYIIRKERQPYYRWWFYLCGKEIRARKRGKQAQKILLNYIQDRKTSKEEKGDLLDMLLSSRYDDGSAMTDQQLIEECLILFVAGHETSANAMTWAFYELAKYPEIIARIRDEANSVSGTTLEQLKQLTYTEQVINEVLRMYPPAYLVDRIALEEDHFGDWTIPKDTMVLSFIYGIHHDPKLWKDPEVFDPERFTAVNMKAIRSGAFIPFGAGPRLCIGNAFAMMEMKLILAEWCKQIDYKMLTKDVGLKPLISLRPDKEIWLEILNDEF